MKPQTMKQGIMKAVAIILSIGLLGGGSSAVAAKIKFSEKKTVIEEIEFKGDLRIRQENFDKSFGSKDRQRQRIRYRQEINVKLPNNLKVKTRLASGGTDPVSTNQTLDSNATTKGINLDRAYVEWKPGIGDGNPLKVQAGKVKNPFFKSPVQNLFWDSDYNPEGATQSFSELFGPIGFFANLGQMVIDEVSGSTKDFYLFTEEVGGEVKLPANSRITIVLAHHEFANLRNQTKPTPDDTNAYGGGNTLLPNGNYAPISIFQYQAVLGTWVLGLPVSLSVNHLKNNAARKTTMGGSFAKAEEQDEAVAAAIKIGKASKKGSFEGSYMYKEIENDAHLTGIGDSDFHDGALNSKGHVISVAYAVLDFVKAQITHFDTEDKVVKAGSTDGSFTRTQFDVIIKFN